MRQVKRKPQSLSRPRGAPPACAQAGKTCRYVERRPAEHMFARRQAARSGQGPRARRGWPALEDEVIDGLFVLNAERADEERRRGVGNGGKKRALCGTGRDRGTSGGLG
jgi:hypothetical protein